MSDAPKKPKPVTTGKKTDTRKAAIVVGVVVAVLWLSQPTGNQAPAPTPAPAPVSNPLGGLAR